mgnify:CR=1 FL=1
MTDIKSSMNADRGDRVSSEQKNHSLRWIVVTCLVALPLAGIYFYTKTTDKTIINESNDTLESEELSTDISETSIPDIPYISPSFDQETTLLSGNADQSIRNITPLMLNKEELAIKMQNALLDLSDSPLLLESFNTSNPIERITAIVDSSSKGIVIQRLLALKPLKEKWSVNIIVFVFFLVYFFLIQILIIPYFHFFEHLNCLF